MSNIPISVQQFLKDNNVNLTTVTSLHGVNPARGSFSFRLLSTEKSYIVKHCTQKREYDTYTEHFDFFKENQINIPEVYFSCKEKDGYWVVIEDIPHLFPKSRWKADTAQIELLFHLHSRTWNKRIKIDDPFLSVWNDDLIDQVSHLLNPELITNLNQIRYNAISLFSPLCCLSGDPNPTNWGIRENGDLVLFDFERIGYGNPSIDLAITMPGFGTQDGSLEHEIACKYIALWNAAGYKYPFSVDELRNQIHLAKLWISLDFLANNWSTMEKHNLNEFVKQFTLIMTVPS